MKVTCEKCGKSFPYEAYNGVCKYCGRYMSMPNMAAKPENTKAGKINKKSQKNSKWTENQKISCTFLAGVMAIILVLVLFDTAKQVKINMALREVGIIKAKTAAMEEDIVIGDSVLKISECGVVKEWNDQVPKDYQLIYIKYETEKSSKYVSYRTDAYIKLPQKAYIEPVSPYRLADEVGIDGEILWKDYGIDDELGEENGQFLFLVPREITEADFAIYCYCESDYEKEESSTNLLQAVYEIPVSWEAE